MSNVKRANTSGITKTGSAISDVPDTPTIGTVSVTNGTTVSIPFTAAATGGTPTSYTARSSPSITLSVSGTSSPLTVTGTFVNNQAYTFTIQAVNSTGTSPASSSSNSVTPLNTIAADYLVIAGGGGSMGQGAGGGGAGGLRMATSQNLNFSTAYNVVVGAGGVAGYASSITGSVNNGGNSSFNGLNTTGGGVGAGRNTDGTANALSGGLQTYGNQQYLSQLLAPKTQTPSGFGTPVQQNPLENLG